MARRGLESHRALEVCVFGIGEGELAIILVFGFLLFGPDKLPQMGRTIGRAIRQFRETQEKMTAVVQTEIIDPVSEAAQAPLKPKKSAADTDDDADADSDAPEAAPARKETFAERRARLAAEKAAQEGETAGEDEAEDGAAADAPTPEPAAADSATAEEPEAEPEPEVRTTADLYARRPRKHKAVVEELARELEAEDAEVAASESAANADAPKGGDE